MSSPARAPEGAEAPYQPLLATGLHGRLLCCAGRAPSPHNARAWRIEVDGRRFRISRDPARQVLPVPELVMRRGRRVAGVAARVAGLARVKLLLETSRRKQEGDTP